MKRFQSSANMAEGGDTSDKKLKMDEEANNTVSFTPREYQIEILEAARKSNTIACLGTGTGKTFIAVMLIREMAHEVRKPFLKDGKRIFFLVPTVPLVTQQKNTIGEHTNLKVKGYYGDMDVDSWNKQRWESEFVENEVLVMTAEIFRIIMDHAFILVSKIQLLIIDECHRAQKNHPYREALKCFVDKEKTPLIFGLSASLLNGKCSPNELEKNIKLLELTMRSTIHTASDILDIQKYGTDPRESIVLFRRYENVDSQLKVLVEETVLMINKLEFKKGNNHGEQRKINSQYIYKYADQATFFEKPKKTLKSLITILESLGTWCGWKAAEMYIVDLQKLQQKPLPRDVLETLKETYDFIKHFRDVCHKLSEHDGPLSPRDTPSKLQKLLDIFFAAKVYLLEQQQEPPSVMEIDFEDDPERYVQEKAKQEKSEGVPLCSIVFVQMRITAYVLREWLLQVKNTRRDLDFLNPEFITGHGICDSALSSMNEKEQRRKLKNFRDKQSNVLVATQVLEEGMDIRQCNLVVRFDLPWDFRSYVQSKGRARAKDSLYVMMVEEGDQHTTFLQDLVNFKTIEKMLLDKCHNRSQPEDNEVAAHMADSEIPPYMPRGPNGARITMNSAIALINRYCQSLPTDMTSRLVPRWNIFTVDPDVNAKEFICQLEMPINSPLRQAIISEAMRREKLAKMSAALKACEMLDKLGELDEHLVPKSRLVEQAIIDELGDIEHEEDVDGAQAGTNRRRRVYEKKVPVFLKDCKPEPKTACYIHVLEMKLVVPLPVSENQRQRPLINPANTSRKLAILSTKILPPVNPFKVFTKCGKVLITVKTSKSCVSLNELEIEYVEKFHRFVFLDALWLENDKSFLPGFAPASYYIIAVNQSEGNEYEVDWSFIISTLTHPYNAQKMKTPQTADRTPFDKDTFKDAVVMRSYQIGKWKEERPTFHHVVKIRSDLSPDSLIDNGLKKAKGISHKQLLCEKYKVSVKNDTQPLVEVVDYPSLEMWRPRYITPKKVSNTTQNRADYREYLIPEMCFLHPFDQNLFFQATCLPTALWRLNNLLLAEEIRQAVSREAGAGVALLQKDFEWPIFNLETSDRKFTEHYYKTGELTRDEAWHSVFIPQDIVKNSKGFITSFEVKPDLTRCHGPAPSMLLQALTVINAGDEFNLERLEMIGDSFLKFAMTVKIYDKYKNFDEGRLTKVRIALIQNLNLYQKAEKKNLGQYLTITPFDSKRNWLPPCYFAEDKVDESTLIKKTQKKKNEPVEKEVEDPANPKHMYYTKQVISDKCIADSVEALIGAYLLTCGYQGALRFMHWFGLKPLVKRNHIGPKPVDEENPTDEDFESWPPPPPNPILCEGLEVEDLQYQMEILTSGFEDFEDSINYKFKNKAYLLQALTHPSYFDNRITDCYQRLEFLGDAVLDYLITRQLYEDPRGHSPGKLTDLRSALVNNMYFASLAVKYKYHKFLKMMSPTLFAQMTKFCEVLEDSKGFKFFEEHGFYLEEIECFALDEVDVPKALGDVFESVAGAIYQDSGMSLDTVWKVCFPMIRPAMEHLCEHVPLSPVRELYERVQKDLLTKSLFGEAFYNDDRTKTYIKVFLPDGREFEGVGPNKKVAKKSAAKRALAVMKAQERKGRSALLE